MNAGGIGSTFHEGMMKVEGKTTSVAGADCSVSFGVYKNFTAIDQDVMVFLKTFFKLNPTATEKELAYYVLGIILEPINGDYLYSKLINPIFTQGGENVKVSVIVKSFDIQTKAI